MNQSEWLKESIKADILAVMERFDGEYNDEQTRVNIRDRVDEVVRRYDLVPEYRVICDGTNNTPQSISDNRLIADIYLKGFKNQGYTVMNFSLEVAP